MTHTHPRLSSVAACLALSSFALLAACGGGGGGEPPHEHTHIESAGRLALIEAASTAVRIYDLDDKAVAAELTVSNPPSAVHASPGGRYAVVMQRLEDQVQFVDGGLWQEDHGDHMHDYKEAPVLTGFVLAGSRPTHYETHEGLAAVFNDGIDGTSASVAVLSDAGIGSGSQLASLALSTHMHGTAEPRGEYLLTTHRDPMTASTLPDVVALYQREGSEYRLVEAFAETCPSLHGSFSNEDHTAFGCSDGVLVITQSGDSFSARKLPNPAEMPAEARIGTVIGHDHVQSFVGIASGLLFEIDPVAGTISPIALPADRESAARAFDAHGENLLVLDDLGNLHLLDAGNGWALRGTLPVVATMPTAAPFPAIAASRAEETAFVSDPVARDIAVIDLGTATLAERLTLDFSPAGMVWLGIEAHEHAH